MPPTYSSGEEIQSGDRILYNGEPGQVEFVAKPGDPQTGGTWNSSAVACIVLAPSFGRLFLSEADEDLDFIARGVPPGIAP